MNFADISYMSLSSSDFLEMSSVRGILYLRALMKFCPYLVHAADLNKKLVLVFTKIGGVIVSLVKIAAVKAVLAK